MKRETNKKRWKKADELIKEGYAALEIGRQIGVSHVAVHKYLKRSGKYEEWKEKKETALYSSRDELIAQGLSVEEIADGAGLTISSVEEYLHRSSQREFYKGQRNKYLASLTPRELAKEKAADVISEELERKVLEAVQQYKTIDSSELLQRIGGKKKFIRTILRKHSLGFERSNYHPLPIVKAEAEISLGLEPKGNYSRALQEAVLKYVLTEKPITLYQIQQKTGAGIEIILNILQDEKALTFIPRQRKRKPEWDELIAQGATLEETGQRFGVSRERIRQYIVKTGQYDFWQERKAAKRVELPQARQELTSLLVNRAYQRADEGGWKYRRKALDYFYGGLKGKSERINKVGRNITHLEKLLTLFETYEMAERLGVRLSLEKLEDRTGITFPVIGRILKSQDLDPMYGARKRMSPLTPELNRAIERACGSEFTSNDVAYFLGLDRNPWVVTQHFVEMRKGDTDKVKQKWWLFVTKQTAFGTGLQKSDYLFYRTASQIYELDDMAKAESIDFPDEEVAKLLEIRSGCVEYARKNRKWIEYDLKRLLRVLYPGKKVEKPYL